MLERTLSRERGGEGGGGVDGGSNRGAGKWIALLHGEAATKKKKRQIGQETVNMGQRKWIFGGGRTY